MTTLLPLTPLRRQVRLAKKRLSPLDYKEGWVNSVLRRKAARESRTYVEVGIRDGESLLLAEAERRIGVDPFPQLNHTSAGPGVEVFAMLSDDFFSSGAGGLPPQSVDVALVDGLHEYRQALRDTLALAPLMRGDGVIVLDDCNPSSARLASDTPTGSAWNGDVWKVIATLRATQPQWRVVVVDADQGVGLIWGLDRPAQPIADETIDHFKGLTYDDLAQDRGGVIGLCPTRFVPRDFPGFAA